MRPNLEAFADLVADRAAAKVIDRLAPLIARDGNAPALITAAEVARRFGVSPSYVYRRAAELGATPLGNGPKARLRFDPARVERHFAANRAARNGTS